VARGARTELDDEQHLAARESIVGPRVQQLTRALRRILQDEQSEALVAARSSRSRPSLDSLVGTEQAQRARYGEVLMAEVADVVQAVGASPEPLTGELEAAVDDLLEELVDHRRRRLAAALIGDAGTDVISEAVRAGAREWSTDRLTTRVVDVLAAAYAIAVFSRIEPGSAVRWVLDDGSSPCSDCDDDVLGDGSTAGTAFPTGHLHPPAHRGCRCLVIAV
jgi:hypothetical protein